MSEHDERVGAALASLEFRYKGVPEDSLITVATFEEGRFGFRQHRLADGLEVLASKYAGDQAIEVWTRTSVLRPTFKSSDRETGRAMRGGEKDTWGTTNIHVDIDPAPKTEEGESLEEWRGRMLGEFERLPLAPSGIESSGRGFHLYWKLGTFATGDEALQKVKQANKWWSNYFGDRGDKCLTKGHRIMLENGRFALPIERIKVGMKLLGYNEQTGELEPTTVVKTFERKAKDLLRIHFASGRAIQVTRGHPFYVAKRGGWIDSDKLNIGDEVHELTDIRGTRPSRQHSPHGVCDGCGEWVPSLDTDHVIPYSQGGLNSRTNRQWLCPSCHFEKSEPERIAGVRRASSDGKWRDGQRKVARDWWSRLTLEERVAFGERVRETQKATNGDMIVLIEKVEDEVTVYNVTCAPHANYFARGLLVHNCFDLSRVLRLPGTWNPKEDGGWATIERHTDLTYNLEEFELASLTPEELSPVEVVEETLPVDFPQQLRTTNQKLWERIYTEEGAFAAGAPHAGGRVIRHRNDYFIALQLLRYGYSEGQVASVLMHPTWYSGSKWREEGRHESYIAVTLSKARQDVASPELADEPSLVQYLRDKHDIMYYGKQWYEWDGDKGVYIPDQYLLSRHVQRYAGSKCRPSLISGTESMLRPWCDVSGTLPTDTTHLINTPDGMLEWETGRLTAHNQGWKSMFQIDAKWDPKVDCREVDEYLASLFEPDAVLAWWEFAGYSLMVEHTQHKWRSCLAIIGPARTGKSTLLAALEEFVGRQYVSHLSLAELTGEGNNFTTSFLVGKLLNIDPDAPYEKGMRNQHLIKQLASGDPVGIERKGDPDHMSANLPVKLAFGMNDLPIAAMADQAFYDRWIPLYIRSDRKLRPFTQSSKETKLNRHLTLLSNATNRSAWLLRSVEGLRSMSANNGHRQSDMIRQNRTDFQAKSDPVFAFLQTACVPQDAKWLGVKDFYGPYQIWCQENGYNPVSTRVLSSRMKDIANGAFSGSETLGLLFRQSDRLEFKGRGPTVHVLRINGQPVQTTTAVN